MADDSTAPDSARSGQKGSKGRWFKRLFPRRSSRSTDTSDFKARAETPEELHAAAGDAIPDPLDGLLSDGDATTDAGPKVRNTSDPAEFDHPFDEPGTESEIQPFRDVDDADDWTWKRYPYDAKTGPEGAVPSSSYRPPGPTDGTPEVVDGGIFVSQTDDQFPQPRGEESGSAPALGTFIHTKYPWFGIPRFLGEGEELPDSGVLPPIITPGLHPVDSDATIETYGQFGHGQSGPINRTAIPEFHAVLERTRNRPADLLRRLRHPFRRQWKYPVPDFYGDYRNFSEFVAGSASLYDR